MTDRSQMEAVVEAILFVAKDPVPRDKLLEVFDEKERAAAAEALAAVLERYCEDDARGILVDEVAGGLRLVSRPDLHGYLRRFFEVTGTNKLSMPALESLAIVAYRQPVTAPEIQELRGVSSSGVLKTLLERHLIRIAGRKEVVGKPFLYATTRDFLQHFGLKSLKELPPLEQFEELFGGDAIPEPEEPEDLEPDAEEDVDRQVAEMDERQDEAMEQAESEAIEAERIAAELAESPEAPSPPAVADDEGDEPEEDEPEGDEPEEDEPEGDEREGGEVEDQGAEMAEDVDSAAAVTAPEAPEKLPLEKLSDVAEVEA